MLGPDYKTPEAQVASQWPTDQLISARAFDAADAYWWKAFNDPTLNALIEAAFRNNPSLQVAGVRVLAARAQLNQSIGNLFPQQQAIGGGVTRYNTTTSSASRTPVSGALSPDYSTDQLLFSASWELDFWGKYRRTIESERASYLGTVASYDDALVTLVADVASSYVNIRTAEERLRVAVRNADIQRESLRVATVQYKFGETSELDVRQATTLLGQTEAQIPRLQNTLNQARNGLAVQLGVAPDHVENFLTGPSDIPSAPAQIAVGIPKDLLRRRPDVRAAGLSAASQSALIGVAKANMYPAFSLSGVFGYTSNNVAGNSLGAEPRDPGGRFVRLAGVQLRPAGQPGPSAGCFLRAGDTQLSEHRAQRAGGSGEWYFGLPHRAAGIGQPLARRGCRTPFHGTLDGAVQVG
jgi:NodT family efflux transporter outer membrane factor (OMF) lipoprotein